MLSQKLWNLRPPRPLAEVLLDRSTSDGSHRTDAPSSQSTDNSRPPGYASSRGTQPDTRPAPRSPQIPAGPVDEVAESITASTAAPVTTGTVWSMTTNGPSLKHQSDTLVANIRRRQARDV